MPSYLVETYAPKLRVDEARAAGRRARAAAEQLSREGSRVRYVRTTFLPDDETCFHVFDAASEEAVGEAWRRAGIAGGRESPAGGAPPEKKGGWGARGSPGPAPGGPGFGPALPQTKQAQKPPSYFPP